MRLRFRIDPETDNFIFFTSEEDRRAAEEERRFIRKYLFEEEGNAVVEATFIVTTTLFVIFLLISFGFLFYQETLLQATANEVATSIARTYSYERKDPVTGYITSESIADQGFDGLYWISQNGNLTRTKKNIAEKYTSRILKRSRFYNCKEQAISVDINKSSLVAFQNEITVTVSESYYIPFTRFFGISQSILKREYKAKSLCYDILGAQRYYNGIKSIAKGISEKSQILKSVKNISSIAKSIINGEKNLITAFTSKIMNDVDGDGDGN